MKPFLILQLRPETEVSDDEYRAILEKGGLRVDETHRIRLDREPLPESLDLQYYAGVIVGGGPSCISDPKEMKSVQDQHMEDAVLSLMPDITERDLPFLGCCYGIGILAHYLGAEVSRRRYGEPVGAVTCEVLPDGRKDPLMEDLPGSFRAFVGHMEAVQELPVGCTHLMSSATCPYQMIRYKQNVYATQFHPEADSSVFELRIHVYKNRGYFPPEEAAALIAQCREEDTRIPKQVLRNFVEIYRQQL
ncbi:MAG: glutamine amidotransferase [Geminicoccaceae bacterium]